MVRGVGRDDVVGKDDVVGRDDGSCSLTRYMRFRYFLLMGNWLTESEDSTLAAITTVGVGLELVC
jgi:hypothetical protein